MVSIRGTAFYMLNGGLVSKLQETMGVMRGVETTAMDDVPSYAAAEVEEIVQRYVRDEVTGTKSGPGRVKDGYMWRSIRVSRRWGVFVAAWESFKPYFAYQERGFWNHRAQREIPGMHAFKLAASLLRSVTQVLVDVSVRVSQREVTRIWSNMNLWRASSSGPGTRVPDSVRREFYEAVNGALRSGESTPRRIFGGN